MKIRQTQNRIAPSLGEVKKTLDTVAPQAAKFFRDITPRKSGNARSKTVLKGDIIAAEYDYAMKLDRGASRQAPNGMSRPTKEFIRKAVRKILG